MGCRCIKTFKVEQYNEEAGQFKRINAEDTIVNLFVHATGRFLKLAGSFARDHFLAILNTKIK